MSWLHSRRLHFFLALTGLVFCYIFIWRLALVSYFFGWEFEHSTNVILRAISIGVRFDLRLSILIMLAPMLLSLLPKIDITRAGCAITLIKWYVVLVLVLLSLVYMVDWGNYAYLGERLDASVLRYFDTPDISLNMVWQTYPVVPLCIVLLAVALFTLWFVQKLVLRFLEIDCHPMTRLSQSVGVLVVIAAVFFGIVGKGPDSVTAKSVTLLRWSEAFFANDTDIAAIGLNPVLFFFDTLKNNTEIINNKLVEESYPIIRQYLQLDPGSDAQPLSFARHIEPEQQNANPPNIVFIMLESLGANRLGLYGNPLGATPNLDALAAKGHFFPYFYVPASGTARTVWGKITGIPDVTAGSTATRNPKNVNQQTVIGSLPGYQNFYFLGGGAHWANMQGVITNNLEDVELWAEGDWQAPRIDVWGISDRQLFKEANHRLLERDTSKPFFAVIQTAANHRPFTIPDEESGFLISDVSDREVQVHGFLGNDQFNAVRLLDYNIGYYFNELVAHSNYKDNTIFLLYGDHNDRSNKAPHLSVDDTLGLVPYHVPFIIYAPGIIDKPAVIDRQVSIVDMAPTAAGLAKIPYINTTLGRDIYKVHRENDYVLIFGGSSKRPTIGVKGQDYYFSMYHDGEIIGLFDVNAENPGADVQSIYPEKTHELKQLTQGLYETSRYLMLNNPKLAGE